MRKLVVVLTLCLAPLAAEAREDRIAVGEVSAAIPKGWKGAVADGSLVLAPRRVAPPGHPEEISVLVSAGAAPAASAGALVEETWKAFAGSMAVKEKRSGPSSKTRSGFDLQLSFGEVGAGGESASLVIGALHRPGAQAVVVIFMTGGEVFERHAPAIGAIIDGIEVKGGAPAPPASPTQVDEGGFPPARGLDGMGQGTAGVWVGLETGAAASVSSMTGVDVRTRWEAYVVLPDGSYTSRLDPLGLNGRSVSQLKARWPAYWGATKRDGQQVTFTTSNGISDRFQLQGDSLSSGAAARRHRGDTGPDLRIEGAFGRVDHDESHFGKGGVPLVVFHPNGVFEDRGAVSMVHRFPVEGGDDWTAAQYEAYRAPGRGAYRIRHNTLYLAYDDGRKKIMNYAVLPTGGTAHAPKSVFIGDYWLTRR